MTDSTPLHRIGRRLGRGAVASVHEVVDPQGQRHAAKLVHASRELDEAAAARFAQEAALLAGLAHEHLVRVDGEFEGVDEHGERREFVRMELVEGPSLDVLIAREAPLSEARAIELGRQLAAGLAYAHGQGIVHRDLKPANVLVATGADGQPILKIADFGMARASSLSGVSAEALTILGTPDYMAPESLDPLAVDARADLYALGCILFELLTGEVPYPAATPFGILRRHRDDPIPILPASISPALRALVTTLMAKSPADRPPSAGVVEQRLAAVGHGALALVPVAESVGSRCAGCGQALVEHLGLCLNCGLPAISLEPGRHCVIITGPGEVGDKMDSGLRDHLRAWLASNPGLGLVAGKWLESRIPRLPVVFASQLSERCAQAIASSLGSLGFETQRCAGLAITHPLVRQKARKLAGRVGLIAVSSMAGIWQSGAVAVAVVGIGTIGALVGTAIHSARAVTHVRGAARASLGPELREAFARVEAVAPALDEARHRHALRAVVRQSLDLREQLGPEHADRELAAALTRASVTTASLAKIDAELRTRDLNDASAETRELLHRRDQLAGRMAELGGALETLGIRLAQTRARDLGDASDEELADLRARVEALEEVQAL